MPEMTLPQIEVICALMLAGTISGAAKTLTVSAPGITRRVTHTEESLGIRPFERKAGLFTSQVKAVRVFEQLREVGSGVENLQVAVGSLQRGEGGLWCRSGTQHHASGPQERRFDVAMGSV